MEKLLEATRSSLPAFNEASINQIIKEAGIPSGQFYMYSVIRRHPFHLPKRCIVVHAAGVSFAPETAATIFGAVDSWLITQAKNRTISTWEIGAMTGNHPPYKAGCARRMGRWKC